eukprot:CAMPEP_0113884180 /NCGR_PEP_ID=MMETSP0780_2-20120614/10088_1 /TAXON_ID=652834 /ORGANISM="Palpitomonas bilix" /LENGTH=142 /DNA_ID=CAMNT_0000871719 /DNA_START=295 /DNA_END=720 /DNA_ORIENTATION=- /assembly_acc=CAM_ASM_000599
MHTYKQLPPSSSPSFQSTPTAPSSSSSSSSSFSSPSSLLGKLSRPLLRDPVVLLFVLNELLRDVANERVAGVGVSQQRADAQQHFRHGQGGAPVVLQYVQADLALAVDVAVVDASLEGHLWWLEWVLARKGDVQKKYAPLVW